LYFLLTVCRYKSGGRRVLRMSLWVLGTYVPGHFFDTNMMVYFDVTKLCVGCLLKKITLKVKFFQWVGQKRKIKIKDFALIL